MKIISKINYAFIVLPVMLFTLGYITLLSSSTDKADSQLIFFIFGILFYVGISIIDYRVYKYFWKYIFIFAVILLIFVHLLGVSKLGSVRWINIGLFTFQPSEIAKLAMVMAMAGFIAENPDFKTNIKKHLYLLLITVPLILLVILQPDLGTAIVLLGIFMFILFFSGVNKLYFLIGLIAVLFLSNPIWNSLHEYQKVRVLVFLNPQLDTLGRGYNVIQSLISIGSGGVLGRGFGKGSQTHMEFLPVHWTDFIFASFAEEWGFLGVIVLIFLYFLLFIFIMKMILKIKDPYGILLSVGILAVFFVQFFINIGMNLGLLPVTGITLPLISHGGSSLVISFIMLGLLQSIWLYGQKESE
jgi:rod shape determining protein RodA